MADGSNIGWLALPGYGPASWNPLRAARLIDGRVVSQVGRVVGAGWACERISPGCKHCYAAALNKRLGTSLDYTVDAPVEHYLDKRVLEQPLHWRKPRCVFVCSMTDLFGRWVTDEQIAAVFGVMAATPQHQYVVLTKRIERVPAWLKWMHEEGEDLASSVGCLPAEPNKPEATAAAMIGTLIGVEAPWPLPNVLIGPSVEDQPRADERMPHAMTLAAAGWRVVVSYEPALGPIDLDGDWASGPGWLRGWHTEPVHAAACDGDCINCPEPQQTRNEGDVSWLLIGAESGAGRRPCAPEWIASAVEQAQAAAVPAFVKQGSAHKPGEQGNLPAATWNTKEFPR